jgi:hypothetical protein
MIRTLPLRLMALQLRHIFLTEARTFIITPKLVVKNYFNKLERLRLPLRLAFLITDSY